MPSSQPSAMPRSVGTTWRRAGLVGLSALALAACSGAAAPGPGEDQTGDATATEAADATIVIDGLEPNATLNAVSVGETTVTITAQAAPQDVSVTIDGEPEPGPADDAASGTPSDGPTATPATAAGSATPATASSGRRHGRDDHRRAAGTTGRRSARTGGDRRRGHPAAQPVGHNGDLHPRHHRARTGDARHRGGRRTGRATRGVVHRDRRGCGVVARRPGPVRRWRRHGHVDDAADSGHPGGVRCGRQRDHGVAARDRVLSRWALGPHDAVGMAVRAQAHPDHRDDRGRPDRRRPTRRQGRGRRHRLRLERGNGQRDPVPMP